MIAEVRGEMQQPKSATVGATYREVKEAESRHHLQLLLCQIEALVARSLCCGGGRADGSDGAFASLTTVVATPPPSESRRGSLADDPLTALLLVVWLSLTAYAAHSGAILAQFCAIIRAIL